MCQAIAYDYFEHYQHAPASAMGILLKLEKCGAFSPSDPAGLIEVAKDISHSNLEVKDSMKNGPNPGELPV